MTHSNLIIGVDVGRNDMTTVMIYERRGAEIHVLSHGSGATEDAAYDKAIRRMQVRLGLLSGWWMKIRLRKAAVVRERQ